MEIDGGLVGLLTAVPLGRAASRAVEQRVSFVAEQPGRLVHVQRVEIANAVVRPGRPFRRVAHPVHADLVVVLAAGRERFRSLWHVRGTPEK